MKTVTIHIEEPIQNLCNETAAERGMAALGPFYERLDLPEPGDEMFDDRA